MHARIVLAVLAATIALSSNSAEARHHAVPQGTSMYHNVHSIDAAAIPAYPVSEPVKAQRQPRQAASHRAEPVRMANHAARSKRNAVRRSQGKPVAEGRGYVTVSTAAGIEITVDPKMVGPITGFIADVVARGYHPHQIHCLNYSRRHVPNSLHFRGLACDFDQRGWGKTAPAMYHVADLAAKWGLRDGGEFRDWGHIDMGPHLRAGGRAARLAANPPFYGATSDYLARKKSHL